MLGNTVASNTPDPEDQQLMTTTILQPVPQKAAPTTTMSPASPVPPHEFTPFTPKNPLKRSYKEDDDDDKEPSAFESPAKRPRRNKENLYHSNTSSALSTPRRMKHGSKLRSINCSRLNSPRRPHHSSNVSSAHASPACSPRRNGFIERVPSSNSPQQFPPLSSVKFTMHMNLNQNQAPCEVTTTSPTYVEDPNDPLACNEICDEFGPFLDSILQSSHCGSPIPSPRVQTPTNFDGSSTFVGVSPSACTSRQGSPGLSGYVFSMPCQESFFNPTPAPSTESPPFLSVTEKHIWESFVKQRSHDYERESVLRKYRSMNCLSNSPELSQTMRYTVVHWMQQVSHEYHLRRTTYHLAVNFFDCILTKMRCVTRDVKLQLYAVTAILFASKIEEEQPPLIEEICGFIAEPCDSDYKEQMAEARDFVFKTEMELMCYLEFDACFASAHDFLLTYFQLLHFYHRDIPHIEPSNYELPIHNESLESLKLCAEKFARSSGVMARAVWDYPAVKFNNSVLAAAIFYWAYDDLFEMNEETFKMITGYSSSKIRSAVDFVGNLPRQSEVDLRQEFPDYGTMGQEPYDIVFHQSETSLKTLEEAQNEWQMHHDGE